LMAGGAATINTRLSDYEAKCAPLSTCQQALQIQGQVVELEAHRFP
jgi:hypothetical protein